MIFFPLVDPQIILSDREVIILLLKLFTLLGILMTILKWLLVNGILASGIVNSTYEIIEGLLGYIKVGGIFGFRCSLFGSDSLNPLCEDPVFVVWGRVCSPLL